MRTAHSRACFASFDGRILGRIDIDCHLSTQLFLFLPCGSSYGGIRRMLKITSGICSSAMIIALLFAPLCSSKKLHSLDSTFMSSRSRDYPNSLGSFFARLATAMLHLRDGFAVVNQWFLHVLTCFTWVPREDQRGTCKNLSEPAVAATKPRCRGDAVAGWSQGVNQKRMRMTTRKPFRASQ